MNTLPNQVNTWIEQWISTHGTLKPVEVEALAGDGSVRSFYRLRASDKTYVLLFDRDWTFSKDYPAHQAYLASCGIPVPKFLAVDTVAGCLVMEDLGDELLQSRILTSPEDRMRWLRKATMLLAHLHGKTFPVPADLPVATRSFDRKKYFDELSFTIEHLCDKFLKLPPLSGTQIQALDGFCDQIAKIRPLVFSHRDYHTRNLLVVGDELYMIDFQDARMGSPHYDLASLLYDAYVPVSKEEKRELTDLYLKELGNYPRLRKEIDTSHFDEHLAQVAFQRVVKAAGSFASFYTRYAKPTHLPYLRPALQSALDLQRNSKFIPPEIRGVFDIENWLRTIEKMNIEKL